MIPLGTLAVLSFGFAWLCGWWAVEIGVNGEKPNHEWVARQLTAGAWTFGSIAVAAMVAAAFYPIFECKL